MGPWLRVESATECHPKYHLSLTIKIGRKVQEVSIRMRCTYRRLHIQFMKLAMLEPCLTQTGEPRSFFRRAQASRKGHHAEEGEGARPLDLSLSQDAVRPPTGDVSQCFSYFLYKFI